MKKTILIILCAVIILLFIFWRYYINYQAELRETQTFNSEYEIYLDKEIYGTELTSIINKAVNNNEKNGVEKDEQGYYISNDENSINIDILIIDNDTTYKMETFYNSGITRFVENYSYILFKCTKIDYNKNGKLSYMLFEQITTE